VLLNLLGNAVKFTERGSVTLRARWEEAQGGRAHFEVEDTGHGIAPEEMKDLFEPFVQTESGRKSVEGTGLGLTITRTIVELMGGRIDVDSELGRGTVFRFDVELPVAEARSVRSGRAVSGLAPGQPAVRVLVVDDKWENRRLLIDLLGPLGFETREAANGAAACEAYAAWGPDVVLMDVRMPVMDGYEATRRIRESERGSGRRVAVIALSASVFLHDRQAILDAGCDEFLAKPVEADELLERIGALAGVRYVYREPEAPEETTDRRPRAELGRVSDELLERLRSAVDAGAIQDVADTIESIRAEDAAAADALAAMLKGYYLDDINEAIHRAAAARSRTAASDD
jgi:CheY-like chemotaxis protein